MRVVSFVRKALPLVLVLSFVGCSDKVEPEYQFSSVQGYGIPTTDVSDSFSCLGISDEDFKSVLVPGYYEYIRDSPGTSPCMLTYSISNAGNLNIAFGVSGMPDIDRYRGSMRMAYFEPYMFYRFPAQVGDGGAFWFNEKADDTYSGDKVYYVKPSADADASPFVALELYHSENDGVIVSRGVWVKLSGDSGVLWDSYPVFKTDVFSALTQLVFWAAQGLTRDYPAWFPNRLPDVNPSPYVPPADGSLPFVTTTAPPEPPAFYPQLLPREYSPTPSGTPT